MATTVHFPAGILDELDRRAAELGTSRNRLIVDAVRASLGRRKGWPPGFFETFSNVSDDEKKAVDEMLEGILSSRRSKAPIEF